MQCKSSPIADGLQFKCGRRFTRKCSRGVEAGSRCRLGGQDCPWLLQDSQAHDFARPQIHRRSGRMPHQPRRVKVPEHRSRLGARGLYRGKPLGACALRLLITKKDPAIRAEKSTTTTI